MRLLALLGFLCSTTHAGVSLRWAPALDQALNGLSAPARGVAQGFDAETVQGLQIRINEVHALSKAHVDDLSALHRFLRKTDARGFPVERLAALERSLRLFAPIIARLESQGIVIDDRGNANRELESALSRALVSEARVAGIRARILAARYELNEPLEQALADSQEADRLLRERYPYLTSDIFDRLAKVYDSSRTQMLVARLTERQDHVAFISLGEQETMRNAVADIPPSSFLQRIIARLRALAVRMTQRIQANVR